MQHARKRNRLAHMLQSADPCYSPLDAHSEARVRNAAVLAEIKIPLESLFRQIVLMNALQEQIMRSHALRSANDLSVAFRREYIDAQSKIRTNRIRLHVKRFHARRIAMHHDRAIVERGKISLVWRAQIAAPLEFVFQLALRVAFL